MAAILKFFVLTMFKNNAVTIPMKTNYVKKIKFYLLQGVHKYF